MHKMCRTRKGRIRNRMYKINSTGGKGRGGGEEEVNLLINKFYEYISRIEVIGNVFLASSFNLYILDPL